MAIKISPEQRSSSEIMWASSVHRFWKDDICPPTPIREAIQRNVNDPVQLRVDLLVLLIASQAPNPYDASEPRV